MTIEAEQAVIEVLGECIAGLTIRKNLFRGPVRPASKKIDCEAVFALETGGPDVEDCVDGGTGPALYRKNVQIRIRSAPKDYLNGKRLADGVLLVLHKATKADIIAMTARDSAPIYLGFDNADRHEWAVNIEVILED